MTQQETVSTLCFWLGSLTGTVFVLLALLHLNWALGGTFGSASAVPERPVGIDFGGTTVLAKTFKPSRVATLAVAICLLAVAALVALRMGLFGATLPQWPVQAAIGFVAAIMLARAVGDFELVGFFKTFTGSSFARMDTLLYSPLCAALGIGLAVVAVD